MFIDCHNHIGVEWGQFLRGEFPYAQQWPDLVESGRQNGFERLIVFPMPTHLALDLAALREGKIAPGQLESVPYASENRRMMSELHEFFPESGRAALPFAMFDPSRETRSQERALRELRGDFRIWGLKTQPTMIQSLIGKLEHEGRVFLELAREWDVPLLIHSSVLPADIWSQARDILRIVENHPDVRFCIAHSCRFDVECLDRIAALANCWFDPSAHGIHCVLAEQNSAIVAPPERRFESDYSDPARVLADLARAYPDKLVWGSDSPYFSYVALIEGELLRLVSTYAAEASYFHALPADLKRRAGWENTLAWLGVQNLEAQ